MSELLQWIGLVLGTIGMIIWAVNKPYSKWAPVLWVLSSICWITVGVIESKDALWIRDVINIGIYIYGAYRWWFSSDRK